MQVLERVDDLGSVALDLELMQSLSPLEQLVHTLVLTQFQQDVYVLGVFEEVLELTYVGVLDAPVDLDLAHELLLGTALCKAGLLDDLGCMYVLCLGIYEFPTLGEASFS